MLFDRRGVCCVSIPVLFGQLVSLLVCTQAVSVLDAYRLVQFDHNGLPYGSRASRMSQYATVKMEGGSLFRQVILVPFKEATLHFVREILDPAHGVSGLVFLIPVAGNLTTDFMEDIDINLFLELERFLTFKAVSIPVYFVKETPEVISVVEAIREGIANGKPPNNLNGGYLMQIKTVAGKLIQHASISNYEGWLSGSEGNKPGKPVSPTIVISAHYDAFSVAPGMFPGSGNNGSGIIALMALIRLFKALYKNPLTQPKLNIIFLLTGGSGMDFLGLQHWLKTTDTRILDSLEFVLCLDSLSSFGSNLQENQELFFHYSKPPKDPFVSHWYDRFEKAAKKENLKLNMMHKKVNLALPFMSWEHEHIARYKVLSGTLSGRREGLNPLFTSSLIDQENFVDKELLTRVIRLVGNAISLRLYHDQQNQDFQSFLNDTELFSEGISSFVEHWIHGLTTLPRMAPFSSPGDDFGRVIRQFLKDHTEKETTTNFVMENDFQYYDGLRFRLFVFKTAGVLFDILLFLGVACYLILMFVMLKLWTQGWNSLMSLFTSSPKKRKKNVSSGKPLTQGIISSG